MYILIHPPRSGVQRQRNPPYAGPTCPSRWSFHVELHENISPPPLLPCHGHGHPRRGGVPRGLFDCRGASSVPGAVVSRQRGHRDGRSRGNDLQGQRRDRKDSRREVFATGKKSPRWKRTYTYTYSRSRASAKGPTGRDLKVAVPWARARG